MRIERTYGWLAAILFGLSMACGGGASEMEHHPTQGGAEHEGHEGHAGGEGEEHAHPTLPEAVEAYHSLMAPIWHANDNAEEGAAPANRGQLACDQAAAFVEHAQSVQSMATPEAAADEATWQGAASGLLTASEGLKAECDAGGAEADQRLTEVHDAFHGIVEQLRAE